MNCMTVYQMNCWKTFSDLWDTVSVMLLWGSAHYLWVGCQGQISAQAKGDNISVQTFRSGERLTRGGGADFECERFLGPICIHK